MFYYCFTNFRSIYRKIENVREVGGAHVIGTNSTSGTIVLIVIPVCSLQVSLNEHRGKDIGRGYDCLLSLINLFTF